jgi:hypothetical protein
VYDTDYIESKHLSIEVKTKLLDVVKNHPDYGAKRISDELNTEKYGFTKLDQHRIYDELKKAKLNTKQKREQLVKRGDRQHIKLPGTPLMTLDGEVILDYESAEQVIAKRRGVEVPDELKPTDDKPEVRDARTITTKKEEPEPETAEEITHPEEEVEAEPQEREPAEEEAVTLESAETEEETEEISLEVETKDSAIAEVKVDEPKIKSKLPNINVPDLEIDPEVVHTFFKTISDDISVVEKTVNTWSDGKMNKNDLETISLSLKIITTHPLLKKLGHVRQLIVQVKKGIALLEENTDSYKPHEIIQNAKEMLKYIEKENILNNSNLILEQINQMGVRIHGLKSGVSKKKSQISELDSIRKKISQKNLIKNVELLENISKSSRS